MQSGDAVTHLPQAQTQSSGGSGAVKTGFTQCLDQYFALFAVEVALQIARYGDLIVIQNCRFGNRDRSFGGQHLIR